MKRAAVVVILASSILSGCDTTSHGLEYETDTVHANGSPVTPQERAARGAARVAECRRLYNILGDRSLTPQQVEAVRVSMNAHFCAGLVP